MDWIFDESDPLMETVIGSFILFLVIIGITRIVGLRSFAKFTVFDFSFTIAVGSIIASTLTSSTSIVHGTVAIASLLFLTFIFSILQKKSPALSAVISNKPLMLMKGNKILENNLKHARIERSQLIAKLREANVSQLDQVLAVVLESTGDISVIHTAKEMREHEIDHVLLEEVRETP
ncbi:DUF421 domain-containing protein [Salinimicrobium marinum]|uniref:DUF421 domain-containing protein n=1 Tax=Salinimicrobium marinum TaxID=680283 RepID=A0A918VXX8_9FLAO|nr:YetF domain-containing protein [Salinimicrobium marinum]GHA35355.1 DUF421 domain-containing protein [Salinimicrobium marinum]